MGPDRPLSCPGAADAAPRPAKASPPPVGLLESTCRWELAPHSVVSVERSTIAYRDYASAADAFIRRLLRVPNRTATDHAAESVFGASILVSTVRCLLTYVLLPILKPVVDLSGGVGPVLGLVLGTVSAVAIVVSMRRFWAASHRWRWGYTAIGGGILVLLTVQAVGDVAALV